MGTGPFEWKFIEVTGNDVTNRQQHISLAPFDHYYAGRPKLDGFSLITFNDDQQLSTAFEKKQLNAVAGLDSVPPELTNDNSVQIYSTPLTAEVDAFFNNSRPNLNDANIRKALTAAVDRAQLVNLLGLPVKLSDSPLLKDQLGYDSSITEQGYDLNLANQLLDQAGWARDPSTGLRSKSGQTLSFNLSGQNTANYTKVAGFLQAQWAKVGVKVTPSYYDSSDLQASVIGSHSYDILLYGINIGVDPDVFAYWDSSQASLTSQGHLNLSE